MVWYGPSHVGLFVNIRPYGGVSCYIDYQSYIVPSLYQVKVLHSIIKYCFSKLFCSLLKKYYYHCCVPGHRVRMVARVASVFVASTCTWFKKCVNRRLLQPTTLYDFERLTMLFSFFRIFATPSPPQARALTVRKVKRLKAM